MVATDGHRLALVTAKREGAAGDADEVKAILPKKTLGELVRLLADGDASIVYERGENHLFFDIAGRRLISRMIDGQFPAYERVIPKGNDKHIEFDRERLTNAVKRVALLSNERSRAVKFDIRKGAVDVTSSSSEFGEAREELAVDYQGGSVSISFNAQYVVDFLNAVETDIVSLSLNEIDRTGRLDVRSYAWRRARRLVPALVVSFILTAIVVATILDGPLDAAA